MSDIDLAKIGNILKARRLEKNLSLRDLSARSDTAASTISQIETGKTSPNLLTLKALCNALDIPVFSLFMDDEISNVRLVRHNEQQTFIRNISNGKALVESLITQGKNEMWGAIVDIPAGSELRGLSLPQQGRLLDAKAAYFPLSLLLHRIRPCADLRL